ncbi:MAG TPA: hypothetical protein VF064_10095 [Pyrinomonadaceae bacterium]
MRPVYSTWGARRGFDVAPGASPQTAYAAMRPASELGSSGFYTINPATGVATQVGADGAFARSGTPCGNDAVGGRQQAFRDGRAERFGR